MACTNDKFVINKGMGNEFIITIKQDDSTLPMIIDPSDTFSMKMFLLSTDAEVAEVTMTDNASVGVIEVHDAPNGQIKITLYDVLVNGLVSERGDKVDNYYMKPTYRIALDCVTVNNGNFVATISKVYVK